ncbi:hypothetical protein FKM82_012881 [Ascaphus truei]
MLKRTPHTNGCQLPSPLVCLHKEWQIGGDTFPISRSVLGGSQKKVFKIQEYKNIGKTDKKGSAVIGWRRPHSYNSEHATTYEC